MHLLSSILLAISSSVDNLGVAIVFGMRRIKLPFTSNLLIAILTSLGTLISMKAGEYVFTLLPPELANYLSSGIMIAAGGWVILQSRIEKNEKNQRENTVTVILTLRIKYFSLLIRILREPPIADRNSSGFIDSKEAFLLGMALSLNNLAGGIGGGMAGLNPELTSMLVFITSLIFFIFGIRIGSKYFSEWLGNRATLIAGLSLMAIGIYELFI
jgi:putative sporulation protein YtaF